VATRASWYVFSQSPADVNTMLSDGATTFNLWHGVGVKRVGRSMIQAWKRRVFDAADGSLTARLFADDRKSPDWFLSTTPPMTATFEESFGVQPGHCVEVGYPRNDHLLRHVPAPSALVDPSLVEAITSHRIVVGYFPTFRDDSLSIPGGASLLNEMGLVVAAQGGVVVFKEHDRTSIAATRSPGTLVLSKESDLNAYLGLCDVLVTDLSSVANDFLLLEKPIVHFLPDLEEFASGRGFAFDPLEMMPGLIARDDSTLLDILSRLEDIPVCPVAGSVRDHFWGDTARPGACDRVSAFIQGRA